MEWKERPSDRTQRPSPLSVVLEQIPAPLLLASVSFLCPPRSALLWLEASSWPPRICLLALLGLTLSFQPLYFAVLAKVVVTHKHMCGQVGGQEEG